MSLDTLKDQLKNNNIGTLYLFYGEEEYLKKYYLEQIEKKLIDDAMREMNYTLLDGKVSVNDIISNCCNMPFFSEKKVVLVKNSGLFKPTKKEAEEKPSKASKSAKKATPTEELMDFLKEIPEHACLVFYEAEVDKRLKLLDVLKKQGVVVEFELQKPAELVKWVVKFFKSEKKEIMQETAAYFVENSEQTMTEMMNEMKKLLLFCNLKETISLEDIKTICTRSIHGRIFDLMDAIVEKNSSLAIKLLDDMIMMKEPIQKILFMIAKQFRQMYEIKLLKESGASPGDAASKMSIPPFTATKLFKHCSPFTKEQLSRALNLCLEMDEGIKTGKIKDRMAAELIILEFGAL